MLLSDYITQVRSLIHDSAGTDWTDAELTNHINNARQTVAMDMACVRTLYTGLDCILNQETYPISGGIGGITMTAGGSGYTSAPTVTFTGGSPTTAATATAVVASGAVSSIYMTSWGAGYSSAPAIGFSGGGGSAAAATATVLLNILDVFAINRLWTTTWGDTLDWHNWNAFQTYCRSNRLYRGPPGAWSNYTAQNKIYLFPIPDASNTYKMEWDVTQLPTVLVANTDNDTQITQPHADAVQYWAACLALMKLQQFDQANVMRNLYKHRRNEILRTRQNTRIMSAYSSYVSRFVR